MVNEPYLIFGTLLAFIYAHAYFVYIGMIGMKLEEITYQTKSSTQTGKLNSYTSIEVSVTMSYDSRNLVDKFLRLNRLNSSMNYLPPIIAPYQILPPSLIQKNRDRLASGDIINKIPDIPSTSAMGTELLNDLITRQEEFLKRIRKHPQDLMMHKSESESEK